MSKGGSGAVSVVERLSSATLMDDSAPTDVPATSGSDEQEVYIYAVLDQDDFGDPVYCKIGVTTNLENRLRMLQNGNPRPLNIQWVFTAGQAFKQAKIDELGSARFAAYDIETLLHKMFASKRVKGEWFIYDKDVAEVLHLLYLVSDCPVTCEDIQEINFTETLEP